MKKLWLLSLLIVPILVSAEGPSRYDNLALGIPGKADVIVDREAYAIGYSERHGQPLWVIYKLTAEEVKNKQVSRSGSFRSDPAIPTDSANPADYRRSGYDRGHLAPAADMAWSSRAMVESFFISNISPQVPAFNRGIWARLEAQVRIFAVAKRELYVVTGPILPETPTRTIGENHVTVPSRYYKVIYDLTPPRKMIGFILPNAASRRPLREFAVTVDAVEAATGLDFFSLLPQVEQEALEAGVSWDEWSWNDDTDAGK